MIYDDDDQPQMVGATDVRRFLKFVDKRGPDECWPWKGFLQRRAGKVLSGRFRIPGKGRVRAPRVAWAIAHDGELPPDHLQVCHSCDYPPCCNPTHLFLGTGQDNMDDAKEKRHIKAGALGPGAKLTAEQVSTIRKSALPQRVLARRYAVSQATVSHIKAGRTWRNEP